MSILVYSKILIFLYYNCFPIDILLLWLTKVSNNKVVPTYPFPKTSPGITPITYPPPPPTFYRRDDYGGLLLGQGQALVKVACVPLPLNV